MLKKTIDVSFEVKAIHEDGDFFTFEGFASTFGNTDRGGDRVIKGAFKETIADLKRRAVPVPNTDFKAIMPVLWQHQHDNPIGSLVEMEEVDEGLFVKGILPKDDVLVKGRVIPQMKTSAVSDMSIGFMIRERTIDSDDVWNLEKVELFEISLVTIPMNTEANITAFKSSDFKEAVMADRGAVIAEDASARMAGDEKAFVAGLVIADIIEEKLTLFPNSIFKAAAAAQINRSDFKEKDIDLIKGLYEKMGLDCPLEKRYLLGENEAATLTPRQFEKFLFASRAFSKEGAKLMASKFKPVVRDADSDQSVRDAAQKTEDDKSTKTLNQILKLLQEGSQNG